MPQHGSLTAKAAERKVKSKKETIKSEEEKWRMVKSEELRAKELFNPSHLTLNKNLSNLWLRGFKVKREETTRKEKGR